MDDYIEFSKVPDGAESLVPSNEEIANKLDLSSDVEALKERIVSLEVDAKIAVELLHRRIEAIEAHLPVAERDEPREILAIGPDKVPDGAEA